MLSQPFTQQRLQTIAHRLQRALGCHHDHGVELVVVARILEVLDVGALLILYACQMTKAAIMWESAYLARELCEAWRAIRKAKIDLQTMLTLEGVARDQLSCFRSLFYLKDDFTSLAILVWTPVSRICQSKKPGTIEKYVSAYLTILRMKKMVPCTKALHVSAYVSKVSVPENKAYARGYIFDCRVLTPKPKHATSSVQKLYEASAMICTGHPELMSR